MKNYKLAITFTQTIIRVRPANSEEEAEARGHEIAARHCELGVVNPDVSIIEVLEA